MLEKLSLSDERIIESLAAHFGILVEKLTFLPLGADSSASVYRAEGPHCSYFVKVKQGHRHDISAIVLALLHNDGIEQIIPPVKTIDGKLAQYIGDFTLVVYPFIQGRDGFSCKLTESQWEILGKVMRRIHEFKVPESLQELIGKETYSPKWREIAASFYIEGKAQDEVASKLLLFMEKQKRKIDRLIEQAGELAEKVRSRSSRFVLCHCDLHAGNVLLGANGSLYIVDWDQPIMAAKERDLMFIGGGVANVWNDRREVEFFYKGYGKTQVDRDLLAYYRHERIVEDIAVYGEQLLLSTAGGKDRLVMYDHFVDMFAPQGVVEIAFQTAHLQSENFLVSSDTLSQSPNKTIP